MTGCVKRWHRFGKDRLYVTAEDGTDLGYRDLLTGENHVADPARSAEFFVEIAEWALGTVKGRPTQHRPVRRPEPPRLPTRHPMAPQVSWHRPCSNRPPRAPAPCTNGADIDHIVIGPPGVFRMNAKHHQGGNVSVGANTMMINGERHPHIYNARHEAQRAARLLSTACGLPVTVTGMVVPVDAEKITIKSPPNDVHVVNRMRLVPWFRELSSVLSDEHVTAIFDAARRSTTWGHSR